MKKIGSSFLLISMFFVIPLLADSTTVAEGWQKTLSLSHNAESPFSERIRTDEVTAGYDFDGDGNIEFLVLGDQTFGSTTDIRDSGASLWLYESNPLGFTLEWSWIDTTLNTGGASFPVHAVTDLDGDGFQEIVLGLPYGAASGDSSAYVRRFYVWEADLNGLPAAVGTDPPEPTASWDYDAPNLSNTRPSSIATGDIDKDNIEEVAIGFSQWDEAGGNGAFMIFSLDGAFNGDNTQWNKELFDTVNVESAASSPVDYVHYSAAMTDVDNDTWGEAYFNTEWGTIFEATAADMYTKYGYDYFQGDNRQAPYRQWTIHGMGVWDLDGDGDSETIFGRPNGDIRILDGITDLGTADTSDMYIIDTLHTEIRGLAVGDIDNDGNADIFIGGGYHSDLWRMEYNGIGAVTDSANWT